MRILSLRLIFIVVFLECCLTGYADEVLKIVYFDDYAPFSMSDKSGKMTGIFVDVFDEVFQKRMKINVKHDGGPWSRMQSKVESGDADAFCTFPNDKRKEYAVFADEPVMEIDFRMYTYKDNPNMDIFRAIKSKEDAVKILKTDQYSVGTYLGSGWVRDVFPAIKFDEAATLDGTIKKLALRRIDVTFDNTAVMRYKIKEMKLNSDIVEINASIDKTVFSFAVSKRSTFLKILSDKENDLKVFEEVLKSVKKDGTYDKIIKKYE